MSACILCDAEVVYDGDGNGDGAEGGEGGDIDRKTPPALRRRVLARDGHCCRCCGSRYQVTVHHIRFRSRGGRTWSVNLICLCTSCHALVHKGLLVLEGEDAARVVFTDAEGRRLNDPGGVVDPAVLLALAEPRGAGGLEEPPEPGPARATLETVPDAIDGAWWRRHAALIHLHSGKGLEFREGRPLPESEAPPGLEASPAPEVARGEIPFEKAFTGIVGQAALLRRIETAAEGSRARGRSFPHTLFVGPSGTGKTTLARGLAASCGARLVRTSGPLLQDTHALIRLLADLHEHDMLFVDEIHSVPRRVLEALYEAMAERQVSLTFHAGARSRNTRFDLPSFTLLAATTEDGDLPAALRNRFGIREDLGYYGPEDLAALVLAEALSQRFALTPDAAGRVATFARGTPREALRLLERVLDEVAGRGCAGVDPEGVGPQGADRGGIDPEGVDRTAVDGALERLGYDAEGLLPAEQRYLALLRRSPVAIPLVRLARMLGTSVGTLTRYVEPFLFREGLVRTTARGRVAVLRPRLLEA